MSREIKRKDTDAKKKDDSVEVDKVDEAGKVEKTPTKSTKSTVKTEETIKAVDTMKDEVIDMLMKKVEELTKLVENNTATQKEFIKEDIINVTDNTESFGEYDEPSANKQIRIVSLCFGELNISTEPFGKGRLVSFSKFGEVKTVLYSTLIDIVNANRKFAENGAFYILDKSAVYYLGLSDYYKSFLSKEIMDNIYSYSIVEIKDILANATPEQKDTLVKKTLKKMYDNESVDLNKCSVIGTCCGVDIMAKFNEMKEVKNAFSNL